MTRWALLLLLSLSGCGGCASIPTHTDLRANALRLEFERGLCSATSIGPNTILTAKHCFTAGGKLVSISGAKVEQGKLTEMANDVVTVEVSGITFRSFAKMGGRPMQGDRVRWWGNPAGAADIYRTGYIVRAWTDELMIDAQLYGGDSGSGCYDDDGNLIGVISSSRATNMVAADNLYRIQFAVAIPVR